MHREITRRVRGDSPRTRPVPRTAPIMRLIGPFGRATYRKRVSLRFRYRGRSRYRRRIFDKMFRYSSRHLSVRTASRAMNIVECHYRSSIDGETLPPRSVTRVTQRRAYPAETHLRARLRRPPYLARVHGFSGTGPQQSLHSSVYVIYSIVPGRFKYNRGMPTMTPKLRTKRIQVAVQWSRSCSGPNYCSNPERTSTRNVKCVGDLGGYCLSSDRAHLGVRVRGDFLRGCARERLVSAQQRIRLIFRGEKIGTRELQGNEDVTVQLSFPRALIIATVSRTKEARGRRNRRHFRAAQREMAGERSARDYVEAAHAS